MFPRILGGMDPKRRMTNEEFARRVGCDFTTASKLFKGSRMPSAVRLAAIWRAFSLDGNELLAAYSGGPEVFSAYLRSRVFQPTEIDSGQDPTVSGA
jgi:transcriptional regulator with XRE-family HTH domain